MKTPLSDTRRDPEQYLRFADRRTRDLAWRLADVQAWEPDEPVDVLHLLAGDDRS